MEQPPSDDTAGEAAAPTAADLTDEEKAVLAIASRRWKHSGVMESHVYDTLGWSMTRFFQVLNELLDRPETYAYDPVNVARLRRLRDLRQGVRSGRPSG
ncbi:DUF3263 domain-containing protein [Nocardioidaceae bacterium]|nr:DUF3263 domain-containing protein [Nocardioidaceae bacterium]